MEPVYRAAAGGAAGTIGTLATYPIDVVRARLTVDGPKYGGSISAVARSIVATDGYAGLYRGLIPTLCAVAPFLGIQQACYDSVKRLSLDAGLTPSVPLCEYPPCSLPASSLSPTCPPSHSHSPTPWLPPPLFPTPIPPLIASDL